MSTIHVNFKRNWFDPAGQRRRSRDNPHEIPAEWKEHLPSDAEIAKDRAPVVAEITKNPSAAVKEVIAQAKSVEKTNIVAPAVAENAIAAGGKRNAKK